jgi:hypothetical protein
VREEDELRAMKNDVLSRAQTARHNLGGLLRSTGFPADQLGNRELPAVVEHALTEYRKALIPVAALLAQERGAENWTGLELQYKTQFLTEAEELVRQIPPPAVPHSSTAP